jgi:predicted MFS family arabinose efflux permease
VNKPLRHLILGAGIFEGTIAGMQDLVQPLLEGLAVSSGLILVSTLSPDKNLKIILGLLYMVISLMSAISTRNAYRLSHYFVFETLLNVMHFLFVLCLLFIAFWIKKPLMVCVIFIVIHIIHNARKPLFIDVIDDNMHKSERATVLSIESQVKSFVTIIVAPLVGFIADTFSLRCSFVMLAVLLVFLFPFVVVSSKKHVAMHR